MNHSKEFNMIKTILCVFAIMLALVNVASAKSINVVFVGSLRIHSVKKPKNSSAPYMIIASSYSQSSNFFIPPPYNCAKSMDANGFINSWFLEHKEHTIPEDGVIVNLSIGQEKNPAIARMYPVKKRPNGQWLYRTFLLTGQKYLTITKLDPIVHFVMVRTHPEFYSKVLQQTKEACGCSVNLKTKNVTCKTAHLSSTFPLI